MIDPHLAVDIPEPGGQRVGTLAVGQRRFEVLHLPECLGYLIVDACQAAVIRQPCGEWFRGTQMGEPLLPLGKRDPCRGQITVEIDGLLHCGAVCREMGQGLQRLFPVPHGFPVGGSDERPGPRLPAVPEGFVPHLPPQGMVGQLVDLLGRPVAGQRLEHAHNLGMQYPPPLLEQAAIGDLVGESMLEGVNGVREELRLVEQLRVLEVRQPAMQHVLRQPGHPL